MKALAFLWQFLPPPQTSAPRGAATVAGYFPGWWQSQAGKIGLGLWCGHGSRPNWAVCMIAIHRMKQNCFWTHSIPNCGLTWLSLLFTVSQMNMFKTFVDWWLHGVILSNILGDCHHPLWGILWTTFRLLNTAHITHSWYFDMCLVSSHFLPFLWCKLQQL